MLIMNYYILYINTLCYFCKKNKLMTFDEAVSMCERIENYTIGTIIKGHKIDSLWIGPTNWDQVCDYTNSLLQKGPEIARLEFAKSSFSVYGVSIEQNTDCVPKHTMIILDDYEKMMCN